MITTPTLKYQPYEYQGICLLALFMVGHHPIITLYNPFRGIFKFSVYTGNTCGLPAMLSAYLREQDVDTKKGIIKWTQLDLRIPGYLRCREAYSLSGNCDVPYPLFPWTGPKTPRYVDINDYSSYYTFDLNKIISYYNVSKKYENLTIVNENQPGVWNIKYWNCKQMTGTTSAYGSYSGQFSSVLSRGVDFGCKYSGNTLDVIKRTINTNYRYPTYNELMVLSSGMKLDIVESQGIKYIKNVVSLPGYKSYMSYNCILYNFNIELYKKDYPVK